MFLFFPPPLKYRSRVRTRQFGLNCRPATQGSQGQQQGSPSGGRSTQFSPFARYKFRLPSFSPFRFRTEQKPVRPKSDPVSCPCMLFKIPSRRISDVPIRPSSWINHWLLVCVHGEPWYGYHGLIEEVGWSRLLYFIKASWGVTLP